MGTHLSPIASRNPIACWTLRFVLIAVPTIVNSFLYISNGETLQNIHNIGLVIIKKKKKK